MILTRSPYYINIVLPHSFVTSVTFTIVISKGSAAAKTPVKTYTVTKPRPSSSTTNLFVDIAPFVRDYFTFQPFLPVGALIKSSTDGAAFYVDVSAKINDTIGSTTNPTLFSKIALDGYGHFEDGQNYQPTKKILLSHGEYKADANGYFLVPLYSDATTGNVTVNGSPVTITHTDAITNRVRYYTVNCNNFSGSVTVNYEGEEIYIELIEECKYPVNEIQFVNRYGALESIHFYKVKKGSTEISESKFQNSYSNGVSYDLNRHQSKRYNVQSKSTTNIETGFLSEDYNKTIKELLLSEYAWIKEDNIFKPINVMTKSLEYKTRSVDKLISYSLDFEYAYNDINNV